jgi:hypothetical protein
MNVRAHRIKCWPEFFRAVKNGDKTCEVRKADRDYRVGDFLMLIEFDPKKDAATGDYTTAKITHILTPADPPRGLMDGFVVLSIERCGAIEEGWIMGRESMMGRPTVEWLKPAQAA